MSVNPHDDYEKLAKLLYPSIEASGNVYYGQTRKLTLDTVFDKYNLGFDSHFKSITDTENNKTFTWRLGPLTDTVRCDVATYKGNDHPLFLKYELSYTDQQVDNTISSSIYHSYEKNISITFKDSIITHCCSPIQNDDGTYDSYDGQNFYLDLKNNFLYVHMGGCDFASEPLTITRNDPSDSDAKVVLAGSNITFNALDAPILFQYNKNNAGWFDYDINRIINLTKNDFVQFRCIAPYTQTPSVYVHFEITNANVDLSGNIQSMLYNGVVKNYAYINMFRHCNKVINADKLIIPNIAPYACKWMFYQCSNLKSAPILPSQTLAESCYASMFSGCTALEDAPILVAKNGAEDCYETLFCDCASLTYIESHLNKDDYTTNGQTNKSTHYWVSGISSEGLFMSPYADDLPYDACNIPSNWEKGDDGLIDLVSSIAVGIYSVGIQSRDHFYTCGSNSSENGRGNITNSNTLSNMEKSFDENKTHPMNTYNTDGSYNQEVWGYKSFNSPVKFRNGLYGECASLITANDNNNIYSALTSSISDGNTLISVGKFNQEIADDEYNVTYNYNLNTAKLLSESSIDDIMPDDSIEINQLSSTTASTGFIKLASSDDLSDYVNWPYTQILSTASYTSNTNDNNESKLDLNLLVVPEAKISAKMVTNKDNIDIISDAYVKCQPNGIGADISLYATHNYDGVENTAYATLSVDRDIYSGDIDKNFRINADIAPSLYSNGIFDIGESDNKFNTVYANYLHGILPYIGNGSYRPEPGSINYSTLHLYSADTDHADIEVHAGDKLTIKHDTSFWINDVQQTGITAYLYSTCLKYDTTSNTTTLTEGRQYGVVSNLYGIEFTPLCDFKIIFLNRRSGSDDNSFGDGISVVVPPKFDDVVDDSIRDIDYDYELAKITDEIEREEGRHHALEVGSVQQWKEHFQGLVGQKITDHDIFGNHDDLFGDNGTLIGNPQYTDPTKPMHTIDTLHTINYSRNDTGIIKLSVASLKNATGTLTAEQQAVKTKLENDETLNENDLSVVKSYAETNIFTASLQNNIKSGLQANFNKKF